MSALYFPFQIAKMGAVEVSKAYSAMRKTANARLARLEDQGLGTYGSFRFPKVRNLTEDQLRQQLAEVSRYMRDPRHTVRGERSYIRNELESLYNMGYDFINESNFDEFTEYMDDLREQYGAKAFDSGDAADVFSNTQKIGIDPEIVKKNYEFFVENQDALSRMKPARSEWGASFEGVKQKIAKLSK